MKNFFTPYLFIACLFLTACTLFHLNLDICARARMVTKILYKV